jgi:hypothetical protein
VALHDTVALRILDVAPPTVRVTLSPDVLWAPNHRLRDITASIDVQDNCDPSPSVTLVSVTSSEPAENFLGRGDRGPDVAGAAAGTDDRAFAVRAERGTGQGRTGRVYTATYRVTDAAGNATLATATVTVPADQGRR